MEDRTMQRYSPHLKSHIAQKVHEAEKCDCGKNKTNTWGKVTGKKADQNFDNRNSIDKN